MALPLWSRQGHPVVERIAEGARAAACALVWYEFLCGPVSEEHVELAHAVLGGRIEPIGEAQAQRAAHLFNAVGRARRLRTDALIAACAIEAGASFTTLNHQDFTVFEPHGLKLA